VVVVTGPNGPEVPVDPRHPRTFVLNESVLAHARDHVVAVGEHGGSRKIGLGSCRYVDGSRKIGGTGLGG